MAIVPGIARADMPVFPMAFYGKVTINGAPAPIGTTVHASYGNTIMGSTTVNAVGVYGVADSTGQKLLVGSGGGVITFSFQSAIFNNGAETVGSPAVNYASFQSGTSVAMDFNFSYSTTTSSPTPPSNNGGGSSSGGGGISQGSNNGGGGISSSGGGGGVGGFFGGGGGGGGVVANTNLIGGIVGDTNGDGKVDILDFNAMMMQWDRTGANLSADLDHDGKVDILDFNLLMIHWSK